MMKRTAIFVAILAIACFSILGCDTTEPNLEGVGDSESNLQATLADKAGTPPLDPGKPTYPPGKVGTIIIDQTPDELPGAEWTLTGPILDSVDPDPTLTGSGDATETGMFAGVYTLTWSYVPGYETPEEETLTCVPSGPITFTGTYEGEVSSCDGVTPGDLDGSGGQIDISDLVYLVDFLCNEGPEPDPLANGDVNADCIIDGDDIGYLEAYMFAGGPAPMDCVCGAPAVGECW